MSECPTCDGAGEVCDNDDCRRGMTVSRTCERCTQTFCSIARGAATDAAGKRVDLGWRDCFTGHLNKEEEVCGPPPTEDDLRDERDRAANGVLFDGVAPRALPQADGDGDGTEEDDA